MHLKSVNISMAILSETGIGKLVKGLVKKTDNSNIKKSGGKLLKQWRSVAVREMDMANLGNKKKGGGNDHGSDNQLSQLDTVSENHDYSSLTTRLVSVLQESYNSSQITAIDLCAKCLTADASHHPSVGKKESTSAQKVDTKKILIIELVYRIFRTAFTFAIFCRNILSKGNEGVV